MNRQKIIRLSAAALILLSSINILSGCGKRRSADPADRVLSEPPTVTEQDKAPESSAAEPAQAGETGTTARGFQLTDSYGICAPGSPVIYQMAHKDVSGADVRLEAENSKGKLVYVGSNPFFYVDKLNNSIPYLVPRASVLLQDIGRAYFDSLQIKGIPLHKIIVTSILRTKDDVAKLRTRNGNATENSCHLYGTTFDICYNRYKQIQTREQPRRQVQNDTLKWVFSEVLRDFRDKNRCYIKYEVKQGCFHITVK